MPIIEPPKTLEDFQQVRSAIIELLSNRYCDSFMFLQLSKKLDEINEKINELKK
jgi:hypothetical protein